MRITHLIDFWCESRKNCPRNRFLREPGQYISRRRSLTIQDNSLCTIFKKNLTCWKRFPINAFDVSRDTPQISKPLTNKWWISYVTDESWFMQESPVSLVKLGYQLGGTQSHYCKLFFQIFCQILGVMR